MTTLRLGAGPIGPGRGPIVAVIAVGLVAGLLVLVAAGLWGGAHDDSGGRRNRALFLAVATFVSLYLALFASFGMVASLTSLLGPRDQVVQPVFSQRLTPFVGGASGVPYGGPLPMRIARPAPGLVPGPGAPLLRPESRTDVVTSRALGAGLIALAALGVFAFTGRKLWADLSDAEVRAGPAARPLLSYLYASAYVALFIAALAAASALYGVFRVVAPGVSLTGGRAIGGRQLIDSAYLTVAAAGIFVAHWLAAHRWHQPPLALAPPPPPPGPAE